MAGDGPSLILVAVDGSRTSLRAGSYAAGLARRQCCPLAVVTVVHEAYGSFDAGVAQAMGQAEREELEELRQETLTRGAQLGLEVTFHGVSGDPYAEILRLAEELRADAVVVGASESMGHRLVGSLATRLVKAGRWPVTVVP